MNFGAASMLSSIGVFGGLGGGGGPGLTIFELDRGLPGSGGAAVLAYFPASAKGGGALNFGRGGDGVRSGDAGGDSRRVKVDRVCCASGRGLLAGGRAGGGPLFEAVVLPVF